MPQITPKHSRLEHFFIALSGQDRVILDRCPPSEKKFAVGMGSAVLITSTMAFVSMGFALTLVLGRAALIPVALLLAFLYGLAILAVDRFLVSMPLRPVRLSPSGDAKRVKQPGRWTVLVAAFPRLIFSLVISFLIAEPLLLAIFHDEVSQRTAQIRTELAQEAVANSKASNEASNAARPGEPPTFGEYRLLRGKLIGELQTQVDGLKRERTNKQQLADAERNGDTFTNRDGENSSGVAECGERCRAAERAVAALDQEIAQSQQKLDQARARLAELETEVGAQVKALEAKDRARTERQDAQVLAAEAEARQTDGLLIRLEALEQLTRDTSPFDSGKGASQVESHTIMGLPLIGVAVWLTRFFIVLLDTLPIVFKIMLSLRERRPYDTVVAELEETTANKARMRHYTENARNDTLLASMDEAATGLLHDQGGAWVQTGSGPVLIGPRGGMFVPTSQLPKASQQPSQDNSGVHVAGAPDGSVRVTQGESTQWPPLDDQNDWSKSADSEYVVNVRQAKEASKPADGLPKPAATDSRADGTPRGNQSGERRDQ